MAKSDIRFDLPNKEAVAFFKAKGLAASFAWQDLWEQEHQKAFTVAKMAHVDLLAETQRLVLQAQQEGWTRARFIEELKPRLVQAGWWGKGEMIDPLTGEKRLVQLGSVPRINTILSTNLRTSRAASQWQKIDRQHEAFPYLKYHALDHGPNRRREHQRWDGLILRWDDPWWETHYPPNGWGCKCSVTQISDSALARMGKSGPDKAPDEGDYEWTNPRTGKTISIPNGIDPGWDYNPGKVGEKRLAEVLEEKLAERVATPPVEAVRDEISEKYFGTGKVQVRRLRGVPKEAKKYGSMSGAPDGARIYISPGPYEETYHVSVQHPLLDIMQRTFIPSSGTIVNQILEVKRGVAPPGFGTRLFAIEAALAAEAGFQRIVTIAAGEPGNKKYVGYAVWPRLGYDGELYPDDIARLPASLAGAKTLLDLYETEEGRAWWRNNGSARELIFDLTPGSRSRRVLEEYLKANGIKL